MKIISLNIWGGHLESQLLQFMENHKDIDIFCLQEVYSNAEKMITNEDRYVSLSIFQKIQAILTEHHGLFLPIVHGIYGIAMFIKNSVEIVQTNHAQIYHNPNYEGIGPGHDRYLQSLTCRFNGNAYTIINIHGLWNGKGKSDAIERLHQSQLIHEFSNKIEGNKIICGDFNLRPDTESFKIISESLLDLINLHNMTSTRTEYYLKEERYADYMLLSDTICVSQFKVLSDVVSDHAPLYAELDVYY